MLAQLPEAFRQQMNALLGPNTDRFLSSYEAPRTYGLRLNMLKPLTSAQLQQISSLFGLEPVPWCRTGYYYNPNSRPGKHPYYAAGIYYIQEPSAMTPAELLDPQPGEVVLDLAAAPGGKTTQIASKMAGQGVLITNEIHPARAKILSENVERSGIPNAIVTNAAPDELSRRFPEMFDRIMLDAPCSGEGMFRKDEEAIAEWSPDHVNMCAARQADILDHAAIMLKPGGRLVYSTCTFNRKENEDTIEEFCAKYPEFTIAQIERIWPHESRGEGHFAAVLYKKASSADGQRRRPAQPSKSSAAGFTAEMALFHSFAQAAIPGGVDLGPGELLRFGDALYWLPHTVCGGPITAVDLRGLKVPRPGLHLGDIRKNRIEPAHALALAVHPDAAAWLQSYPPDSPEIAAFLRGETIPAREGNAGWGLVAVDGHPLGWGKASDGQIKNHLPKGLRRLS